MGWKEKKPPSKKRLSLHIPKFTGKKTAPSRQIRFFKGEKLQNPEYFWIFGMAERVGFEPTVQLPRH
jgi:hypothetical protein